MVRVVSTRQRQDTDFAVLDIVGIGYATDYTTRVRDGERLLDRFHRERTRLRPQGADGKGRFRIVAPGGWSDDRAFIDFYEALKRLERVRRDGRADAVIVDAVDGARR